MTFQDRYDQAKTWQEKVFIIEIYHLAMSQIEYGWTVTRTAQVFGLSVGLVSENLRLAELIHTNERILKCQTRQDALRKLNRW